MYRGGCTKEDEGIEITKTYNRRNKWRRQSGFPFNESKRKDNRLYGCLHYHLYNFHKKKQFRSCTFLHFLIIFIAQIQLSPSSSLHTSIRQVFLSTLVNHSLQNSIASSNNPFHIPILQGLMLECSMSVIKHIYLPTLSHRVSKCGPNNYLAYVKLLVNHCAPQQAIYISGGQVFLSNTRDLVFKSKKASFPHLVNWGNFSFHSY